MKIGKIEMINNATLFKLAFNCATWFVEDFLLGLVVFACWVGTLFDWYTLSSEYFVAVLLLGKLVHI